jgi:hypothetical protein
MTHIVRYAFGFDETLWQNPKARILLMFPNYSQLNWYWHALLKHVADDNDLVMQPVIDSQRSFFFKSGCYVQFATSTIRMLRRGHFTHVIACNVPLLRAARYYRAQGYSLRREIRATGAEFRTACIG